MLKTGIFLFSNDLRLEDNPALTLACREMDKLICLYCPSQPSTKNRIRGPNKLSTHRLHFLHQSLQTLDQNLHSQQQYLLVREQPLLDAVAELITLHDVTHVYRSRNAGWYENHEWNTLVSRYPGIMFQQKHSHTLFTEDELPFELNGLPTSFSKFRRLIEPAMISSPTSRPPSIPPSPLLEVTSEFLKTNIDVKNPFIFEGGENAGRQHLNNYFSQNLASSYKLTRNGLDGMDYSTKFSPWLSNGCLSVRSVTARLREYEKDIESNDSTYWIYFELLWREYYQWYAHKHQSALFTFKGISASNPKTSFYPQRYQKWCHGNTPFPIINALMNQLNTTGYMSNRGRQLVASCFVHELNLDWRYGAAFMESQLIDYDIASNWGNWQYLAGVGADPRGHRKFDLDKQQSIYDPNGAFTNQWRGNEYNLTLDSVDASDWPIQGVEKNNQL